MDSKYFSPASLRYPASSARGSALVIVLAFVVLMTGISFAIFTRAMSERKISNSSVNQSKVSLLADGAAATIVADLNAEIVGKSTAQTISGTLDKLYLPNTPKDMVPERVGTDDTLPNLVKRSASGQAPFAGGAARASGESTITPSQNGRYISPARWNSSFLLPKATASSDTDTTPEAAFTPPDWILVDKTGANPTSANTDVVGRYAYAIYDEGGLLDLNAAGFPAQLATDKKSSQRGSLAFADLTQLTENSDGSGASLLTSSQIDGIVGRRNFVSSSIDVTNDSETSLGGTFPNFTFSTQNAENYRRFALYNSVNFLTTPRKNSLTGNPDASDRMFLTRQEMISFLLNGIATDSSERAKLQSALQYLTQFTRDLNQPSIVYPTGRPKASASQGSNAYKYDTGDPVSGINPTFLKVRRSVATTRDTSVDGSISEIGAPLIPKRFPLNRLAWVTFKGPIADNSGNLNSDADIKALIDLYKKEGLTEDFLKKGTAKNIKNAFGLEWGPNPNASSGTQNLWIYRGSEGAATPKTRLLSEVAATSREPDFFELLRGAVTAGAITRSVIKVGAAPAGGDSLGPLPFQSLRDESTVLATIQLGANIIDQFDPDGYPIEISIDDGTGVKRVITGVENLPYIYRVRNGMVMFVKANPELPASAMFNYPFHGKSSEGSNDKSVEDSKVVNLTATGVAGCLMIPDVWNPHNSINPLPTLGPTQFRIVVDSINPDDIGKSSYYLLNMVSWKNGGQAWSDVDVSAPGTPGYVAFPHSDIGFTGKWKRKLSDDNSVITFSGGQSLFRDPTILFMANKPAGSNLGVDRSKMATGNLTSYVVQDPDGSGYGFVNVGAIDPVVQPGLKAGKAVVGIPVGLIPLRWVAPRISKIPVGSQSIRAAMWAVNVGGPGHGPATDNSYVYLTFRLQCLRPGASAANAASSDWLTYDTKYIDARIQSLAVPQGRTPWGPIVGNSTYNSFADPRTAKFGPSYPQYFAQPGRGTMPPPVNSPLSEWLDATNGTVISDLSTASGGIKMAAPDWIGQLIDPGTMESPIRKGLLALNLEAKSNYYKDADGVTRPAMGANVGSSDVGLPTAPLATQQDSRPVMLDRPFRSVGELGYVFSGMPWRNIDFSHPQSGYSSLLDVFCINETADPSGLVAGKVNLNARQIPVLKAIVAGAYKSEVDKTDSSKIIDPDLAGKVADALVKRTTSTGPLENISELVGKWVSGSGNGASDYDGFTKDLFGGGSSSGVLTGSDAAIGGFGESVIRSLADVGTTRVWNLMIDLIAQTGKYPPGGAKFVVEGEQRLWVHVAIDRFTGKVIDMNTEIVKE